MDGTKSWWLILGVLLSIPFSYADLSGAAPEAHSFIKPPGPSVNLFTGDMTLGVPLLTVPGRGGMSFPITLSYSAGITVGQESSWVGLGWNLAPGAITRNVNGIPDDYQGGLADSLDEANIVTHRIGFTPAFVESMVSSGGTATGIAKIGTVTDLYSQAGEFLGQIEQSYDALSSPSGEGGDIATYYSSVSSFEADWRHAHGFLSYDAEESQSIRQMDRINPDSYALNGPLSGSMFPTEEREEMDGVSYRKFHLKDAQGGIAMGKDDPMLITYEVIGEDDVPKIPSHEELVQASTGNALYKPGSFASQAELQEFLLQDAVMQRKATGSIKSFTVTDKSGARYIFGFPVYNVNRRGGNAHTAEQIKSSDIPVIDQDYVSVSYSYSPPSSNFIRFLMDKYAYAWLLTEILAPDYQDSDDIPGPSDGDAGNWIRFHYEKAYYGDPAKGEPGPFAYRSPFGARQYQDPAVRGEAFRINTRENCPETFELGDCTQAYSHGWMEVAYLSSVETPTHQADFITSDKNDGVEFDFEDQSEADGDPLWVGRQLRKLDEVRLQYKPTGELISKVKLDYDYSLNRNIPNSKAADGGRLTLKKVQQFDAQGKPLPPTTFEYPACDNLANPDCDNPSWQATGKPDSQGWRPLVDDRYDDFGYFFADGTRDNHRIADRKLDQFGFPFGTATHYQLTGVREGSRTPLSDISHADAWSLTKVCWPGGSCTAYDYEIDRFSWAADERTVGIDDLYGYTNGYQAGKGKWGSFAQACLHYGGGIRVKEIAITAEPDASSNAEFIGFVSSELGVPLEDLERSAQQGESALQGRVVEAYIPVYIGMLKQDSRIRSDLIAQGLITVQQGTAEGIFQFVIGNNKYTVDEQHAYAEGRDYYRSAKSQFAGSTGEAQTRLLKRYYYRSDGQRRSEPEPRDVADITGVARSCTGVSAEGIPIPDGSQSSGVASYRNLLKFSHFNNPMVGYSMVTEELADGITGDKRGYIVHEFTTAKDYPPEPLGTEVDPATGLRSFSASFTKPLAVGNNVDWKIPPLNYADRSSLWGLETRTALYDEGGKMVQEVVNAYDTDNAVQQGGAWSKACSRAGAFTCQEELYRAERMEPYWITLAGSSATTDGVTITTSYEYNEANGMQRKAVVAGDLDPGQGIPTKISVTEFAFEDAYPAMQKRHILDRAYETRLYENAEGDANLVSMSRTEYWQPGFLNLWNREYFYFPPKAAAVWRDTDSAWIQTSFDDYDRYGNLLETTDPLGRKTRFFYGDNEDPEDGEGLKHAFLTKGINALGQFMVTRYDPAFGVVTAIMDFNGQQSDYVYDSFGRLVEVWRDGVGSGTRLSEYSYDDASFDWRKSVTALDESQKMELVEFYDGLARPIRTELQDSGRKIVAETEYDPVFLDRMKRVTAPFYSGQRNPAKDTYTYYEANPLARVSIIDPPGLGEVKTEYTNKDGKMPAVVVTDEEGRQRASVTDIYGNLREVIEPLP